MDENEKRVTLQIRTRARQSPKGFGFGLEARCSGCGGLLLVRSLTLRAADDDFAEADLTVPGAYFDMELQAHLLPAPPVAITIDGEAFQVEIVHRGGGTAGANLRALRPPPPALPMLFIVNNIGDPYMEILEGDFVSLRDGERFIYGDEATHAQIRERTAAISERGL